MIKINSKDKNLVIQFCQLERIKSAVLNMMQTFLRLQDYLKNKEDAPDCKTILSWFLNLLNNDITNAANISKSENLFEAQNLTSEIIQKYSISGLSPNFQELLDLLRNTITKITSEAAKVAKELNF